MFVERSENMNDETDNIKIQIKQNINVLINNGKLEEAKALMEEYKKIVVEDVEVYSIQAVILIMQGKLEEAEEVLKDGIAKYNNFDLFYNLGYLYEKKLDIYQALKYYKIASDNAEEAQKNDIEELIKSIEKKYNCYEINNIANYFDKEIDENILEYFKNMNFNKIIQEIQIKINHMKYSEVIIICDYWIKNVDGNTAIAYYFMGVAANGIKDFENALRYHRKALEIDNSLADLRNGKSAYQCEYEEESTHCIGCGNENFEVVNVSNQSSSEDNKQLVNPIRTWVKCKNCGLIYTNPIPTEEILNKYYSVIAKEKFGGIYGNIDDRFEFLVNMANKRLEKIEKYIGGVKALLDIGTGIGVFTGTALDRGWLAEGLEFTPEDCKYAKEKFDLNLKQENFYSFKEDRKYDVVTLFEVIEHLRNPLGDLKQINKLIKNDGILVIATPIQDSLYGKKMKSENIFWNVVTHLSYFTKDVMLNYLKEAGFEILEINNSNEGMGRMEFYCKKVSPVIKTINLKSRKLNIGCGRNSRPGWLNLDIADLPGVDVIADLDNCRKRHLPFEDNSFEEFYASHVIEHIKDTLGLMQELHRIAKPNAKAIFRCPYGSYDSAFEDPTHVRQYFINSFEYFSQPAYWRADYGYRGDWLTEKIILVVDKNKYNGDKPEKILNEAYMYRNVVREMIVELKAIKPIREAKKDLQVAHKIEIQLV